MQINKLAQYISLIVILGMLFTSCSENVNEDICAFKLVTDLDTTRIKLYLDLDEDGIEDINFYYSSYSSASGNGANAYIRSLNNDWLIASSSRADTLVIDTSGFEDPIGMFSTLRYDITTFNRDIHEEWDSIRIRTIPYLNVDESSVQCDTLNFAEIVTIYHNHNSNYMYGIHDNSYPYYQELEGNIILSTNEYCYLIQMKYEDYHYTIGSVHRKCNE